MTWSVCSFILSKIDIHLNSKVILMEPGTPIYNFFQDYWSTLYLLNSTLIYFCINSLRPSDQHIWVSELTIIGSDNGLSPGWRQAIIWNNAGLLLIEPLGTYFSEISIGIQTFSFKKMHLNMSSAKWCPFCLDLNVLTNSALTDIITTWLVRDKNEIQYIVFI